MASDPLSDINIVKSWLKNATPWTAAVRRNEIASRALVTNQAIIDAVLSRFPRTILDIGCGEGWLSRALAAHGVEAIGVDVVPDLIEEANEAGGGDFRVVSYEQIAAGQLKVRVDVAVANFSLIGKESVEGVVRRAPALINPGGSLVIQTLHPVVATGDEPYVDGWRQGTWTGFGRDFSDPAPWYFRTIESWVKLITSEAFDLVEMREPLHPETNKPASLILIAEPFR
jgi:2-polyprenyl-3-methyl-5-hydroxy-6-metoxy-1,4-benzoquinol methylase